LDRKLGCHQRVAPAMIEEQLAPSLPERTDVAKADLTCFWVEGCSIVDPRLSGQSRRVLVEVELCGLERGPCRGLEGHVVQGVLGKQRHQRRRIDKTCEPQWPVLLGAKQDAAGVERQSPDVEGTTVTPLR